MNGAESLDDTALTRALSEYESCLSAVDPLLPEAARLKVLETLLARDRVAKLLAEGSPQVASVETISELDDRLKKLSSSLRQRLGDSVFREWRDSLVVAPASWWWSLDQVGSARSIASIALDLVQASMFALLLVIVLDLLRRFLAGGPDVTSLSYVVLQTLVTIGTGTAFTAAGSVWLESILEKYGFGRSRVRATRNTILFIVVFVAITIWANLDRIASVYTDRGAKLAAAGEATSAMVLLQRAIALSPEHVSAHYNLGGVYESLGDYDSALKEYETTLRSDAMFYPASNNAAHLLLKKKDFSGALQLLDTALTHKIADESIQYSLWKNRASAHLGLGHLIQGEEDAAEAIRVNSTSAAAHCVLAKILELKADARANAEWRSCLANQNGVEPVDAELTSEAEEHLRKLAP